MVILTGYVPDNKLVDYYNLCDVFVMPSKKEGFGIVFLEALACGKPVIAGNKDGSVDAILNGNLGALVDPDNLEQITESIINFFSGNLSDCFHDPEYLRATVLKHYGLEVFHRKAAKLLEQMGQ
ncbi:GDP-mannose-dependent alpha-(1-6)-phosphatidylinositol monomannoside mannosyltransferase [subsurface metagenome]